MWFTIFTHIKTNVKLDKVYSSKLELSAKSINQREYIITGILLNIVNPTTAFRGYRNKLSNVDI